MKPRSLFDERLLRNASPQELLDALAGHLPTVARLKETPQDPLWHAEGDVRVHTERVVAEARALAEDPAWQLSTGETASLVLGAALHDLGKPVVTRVRTLDGIVRVVSPRHAAVGRSLAAPALHRLGLEEACTHQVLGLIGYHHEPARLVRDRQASAGDYRRLARSVSAKLVYLLEVADIRGRDCQDPERLLETLELFRMGAEEFGVWDAADPYAAWADAVRASVSSEDEFRYVMGEAVLQFEEGLIRSPEEALARTYAHRRAAPLATILCGPSASGKSIWAAGSGALPAGTVSLDGIRSEIARNRDDQSENGRVLQLARERWRAALRARRDIVWDGTSLRRDGRAALLRLARDYHARTRIVVFAAEEKLCLERNAKREHSVPGSVIRRQFERWEWPELHEAHEVVVVS